MSDKPREWKVRHVDTLIPWMLIEMPPTTTVKSEEVVLIEKSEYDRIYNRLLQYEKPTEGSPL